jgi:hypothetical protein
MAKKEEEKKPTLEEKRDNLTKAFEEAKAQVYRIEGALSIIEELIKEKGN